MKQSIAATLHYGLALLTLLGSATALAQNSGCIEQGASRAGFVPAATIDRATVSRVALAAYQARAARFVDPCAVGDGRQVPAALYQRLAQRAPWRYEPMPSHATATLGGMRPSAPSAPSLRFANPSAGLPAPYLFFDPRGIDNKGDVHGTAYQEIHGELVGQIAAFAADGTFRVLYDGIAAHASGNGTIGGLVMTDPVNFFSQAAVFHAGTAVLIPRRPGEISSEVWRVNDRGQALIFSLDANFEASFLFWDGAALRPLDFGPDVPVAFFLRLNNEGVVSGTTSAGQGERGFRHDTRTGVTALLQPAPTETHSWAVDLNNRGEVLGYSFEYGGVERIGIWDRQGALQTWMVQGVPERPTVSNRLAFNDSNQIVVSAVTRPAAERGSAYVLTRPGVRVGLAQVTAGLPTVDGPLDQVLGLNASSEMWGLGGAGDFVLRRGSR